MNTNRPSAFDVVNNRVKNGAMLGSMPYDIDLQEAIKKLHKSCIGGLETMEEKFAHCLVLNVLDRVEKGHASIVSISVPSCGKAATVVTNCPVHGDDCQFLPGFCPYAGDVVYDMEPINESMLDSESFRFYEYHHKNHKHPFTAIHKTSPFSFTQS